MSSNKHLTPAELAAKRAQLKLRSMQLREQLAGRTVFARPAFIAADRVRGSLSFAQQHPALIALAGAVVAGALIARPRAVLALGMRVWSGWQTVRRVQPLVNTVLRQLS